jgi:uncharacterized PurR-regulated membrane protein YhhQ (DUF165 family)
MEKEMLYLDKKLNRLALLIITSIVTAALLMMALRGINAVGILLAVGLVNIAVYYAMPDTYSKAYAEKYLKRYN